MQKAFVTERAELIDNNRKKWDTSMLQRRDKEVMVESSYTFPITPVLVGNHSNPAKGTNLIHSFRTIAVKQRKQYSPSQEILL